VVEARITQQKTYEKKISQDGKILVEKTLLNVVCVCVFRVCIYVYVSVSSFTSSVITNSIRIYIYIDATGVKFVDSVLSGSRFYRANLKDADFSRASLVGTSLEDTDLKGARFTGSVLKVHKLTLLSLFISFPFPSFSCVSSSLIKVCTYL